MPRSRRDDFKPWARDLPTIILRSILLLCVPVFLFVSAWDGGMKEGWREFVDEWRAAGAPRREKGSSR